MGIESSFYNSVVVARTCMLSRASFAVTWTGIAVALPNTITQKASGRLRLSSMCDIRRKSRSGLTDQNRTGSMRSPMSG